MMDRLLDIAKRANQTGDGEELRAALMRLFERMDIEDMTRTAAFIARTRRDGT